MVQTHANILWTLLAACLVFWMQAGFAFVESGFTRAKSAAHIMMKNMLDMSLGALSYWALGFGLMFGASTAVYVGGDHFFLSPDNGTADGQWEYTFWMFQVVFAATAATIVSGAMAERTKFRGYLIYSIVISAIIYPVFGHWAWVRCCSAINRAPGWRTWDFSISPARRSFTRWAPGRHWREPSWSVRASASSMRKAGRVRSRATA